MSKLRSKLITILAVLLCAMLALSAVSFIPKNKNAAAATSVTINELYNKTKGRFDYDNLQALYNAILDNAGGNGKTYTDLVNTATVDGVALADKEIEVTFGDLTWTAVCLSKSTEISGYTSGAPNLGKTARDSVVLTLWLSGTTQLASYQNINQNNLPDNNFSAKYPTNLYGTSYVRTKVLNNGGDRWADDNNVTYQSQAADNDFARFTMDPQIYPNVQNNVSGYLVSPRYISWQNKQSLWNSISSYYDLNNEAWGNTNVDTSHFGVQGGNVWYYGNRYSSGTDYYSVWKDDLLWIPSLTETGGYNNDNGLWQTTLGQRECVTGNHTMLRSAYYYGTRRICSLDSTGAYRDNDVTYITSSCLIRPAIHLNLTIADGDSRNVFYNGDKEVDEFYTGGNISLTITDYDKVTDSNRSANSYYTDTTGEFYAILPNNDNEKYEITVTPNTNFYWADTNTREGRKYYIHIKPAKISSGLKDSYSVTYGQNLIQTPNITSLSATVHVDFEIKYHQEFNSQSPPSDTDKPSETDELQWSADNGTFTADNKGYYRIWYRITANNHTTLVGSYVVQVNSDNVTAVVTGIFGSGSAEYAKDDALLLTDTDQLNIWFNELVDSGGITMTGKEGAYTADKIKGLLGTMDVILCTKNSSGYLVEAPKNAHGNYDVGEYYIDLVYKIGSGDVKITWTGNPVFEVTKRPVKVKIVAQGGGSPSHVYGDSRASLDYEISGIAPNEGVADLNFGSTYRIVGSNNGYSGALNSSAPAGEYAIEVTAGESNYKVDFSGSKYTVTPCPIKLKVTDETVEYGTDFSSYTFRELTVADGSLVGTDTVPVATRYFLLYNSGEMELSSTLSVGKHFLCAEATSANYEITEIIAGTLTITKANFNMSGVKLENKGYTHDGNPHPAQISGDLPDGVSVSYRYVNVADGSESTDAPVEIGLYLAYATFTHSNENYNEITDKVAYIRIAATREEADKPFPAPPTPEEIAAAAELAKKKQEAKKDLEDAAGRKREEIDSNTELTDEERQAAKAKVDEELAKGNAAIDGATDTNAVDQAYNEGKTNIEKVKAEHKVDEPQSGSFPWWIIAAVAGVLAVVAVIIVVILKKRNSEDDEDEYYDDEDGYDEEEDYDEDDLGEDF